MFSEADYGAAIRALRQDRSQKDCARLAGVNRGSWSQYERGHKQPSRGTLERIAAGLGVSEEELTEAVITAWRGRTGRLQAPSPVVVHSGILVALGQVSLVMGMPPAEAS